ncbi:MAG: hypothetical protein ACJ75B_08330 [Flavisolibacter sp.]
MSAYTDSIKQLYEMRSQKSALLEEQNILKKELQGSRDERLQLKIDAISKSLSRIDVNSIASITNLYAATPTDPLSQINEEQPILFLPLRLETRFAANGTELWIRAYPDEISVHSHESALTASEIEAGSYYWKTLWKDSSQGDFEKSRKKRWSSIAQFYGANRAAWIIKKMQPLALLPNDDFSAITKESDLVSAVPETKSQSWNEPLWCHVMPDLLKLQLYIKNTLILELQGNPVPAHLPLSPDPKATTSTSKNLDWKGTDFGWVQDFDSALQVGMAFKVNLLSIPTFDPKTGFSHIVVSGIRTLFDKSPLVVPPDKAGAEALEHLFENHLYVPKGFAFVSQGTPSNNTEEKKSGYQVPEAYNEEIYQQELQSSFLGIAANEMEDGKRTALTLGINPELFQKVQNSHATEYNDAVSMNKALYPATLGFYLENLLNPLFKIEELKKIREFFCSYVTGRGPLPVISTGAQPYGILPTSNFKKFQWTKLDKNNLLFQHMISLLSTLDKDMEKKIPDVTKLGIPGDAHVLLDQILGLYPNSEIFLQRFGYSQSFLRDCLHQTNPMQSNPFLEQLIQSVSTFPGATSEGMVELKKIIFERPTTSLDRNKLVDLVPASESEPILPLSASTSHNYIEWLAEYYIRADSSPNANYFVLRETPVEAPLLYHLLRHGLLTQLYKCVYHWLSSESFFAPNFLLFNDGKPLTNFVAAKEYINFFGNHDDITPMELMLIPFSTLYPTSTPGPVPEIAASHLLKNADNILNQIITRNILLHRPTPPALINNFNYLKEYFTALEYLMRLPSARVERAFIEHLDCLGYRLDAWQTGLCFKKLEMNVSATKATGTVIGAYGWLENLKPDTGQVKLQKTDLPNEWRAATNGPILAGNNDGGYIHTPSVTQAKAAALVRSAYLHHFDAANPQSMAVNLNSERARKALNIYEGIQMGHTLGELLGARLERFLHDQAIPLDQYLVSLRAAYPLRAKTLARQDTKPDIPEVTEANRPDEWVTKLDGLTMINTENPLDSLQFAGNDKQTVQDGIDDLKDCVDAMKDLMVFESIHQLVQGNTDRAGALLKSINELRPPAKFESLQTPRTPARLLTHRACVLLRSTINSPVNPWPNVTMTPKAFTEPALNEWLGEMIGMPNLIECTVTDGDGINKAVVTLEDLNMQPIDFVYMATSYLDNQDSELSSHIEYSFRKNQQIKDSSKVNIDYKRASKNNLSIADVFPLLKRLKELIANAKPLDASDFDPAQYSGISNYKNINLEKSGPNITDMGALAFRKQTLVAILEKTATAIEKAIDGNHRTTCDDIRNLLLTATGFAIPDAFPNSFTGEGSPLKEALIIQALEVLHRIEEIRVKAANSQSLALNDLVDSFQVFFGPAFKVFPVFHLSKIEDGEIDRVSDIQTAYAKEPDLFQYIINKTKVSSHQHIQNWLSEVTYIRNNMLTFETSRLLSNALLNKKCILHILQLPYVEEDSWLGIEFSPDMRTTSNKLSMLVHHFPEDIEPDWARSNFSGMVIDEWVEEIPVKEELTGITFQYNQPDSEPPQALLLVISPEEGGTWNWDKVFDILMDTLRRAKQRGLNTDHLSKTDWVGTIPGIVSEFSATNGNVSLLFKN